MEEKDIDNLAKKLFEDYKLKRPSDNFTDVVMLQIEQSKSIIKQENKLFPRKFILFFILTFTGLITAGAVFSDKPSSGNPGLIERFGLPSINIQKLIKLLDLNIEIGLFAKLILASVALLIIIDLVTGSAIDYFIDYRSKK